MNFEALKKNFAALNEQIDAVRKEMSAKSTHFVEAACNQLFEVCPEIDSVFWMQYTPYFNDGDVCEFSVHEPQFTLVDDEEPDFYEGSYLYVESDLDIAQKHLEEALSYAADPGSWVEAFKTDYLNRYGRDYYTQNPRPVYSIQSAQEDVDRIRAFLDKYTAQDVERINAAYSSLANEIRMVDEDIMRAIYGDHVKVTITRDGTEIESYEHD